MTSTVPRPACMLLATFLLILTGLSVPVSAFSELHGTHLTGCVLLENPYVVLDPTRRTGFSGIAITYLERLQDNLQFTIDLELWEGSFTSFVDKMATCSHDQDALPADRCPCNVGIGSFTMTNDREERINFVWPFSNEAHAMVSRKADLRADDSQNAWFVFKTFTPSVWVIIFVGIFLHALGTLFYGPFFEKAEEASRQAAHEPGICSSCTSVFWLFKRFPAAVVFAYSHLVGYPVGERAHGTPSFHRSAWLVLGITAGLFLLTIYEASLTVLLFESTVESPFRTLSDITDCNLDPSRVSMIEGGASQKFWNRAVNTSANMEKCGWDSVGVTVDNLEQGFRFVKEGKADYFYSLEGSVKFRANRNCQDFKQVGEPFFSTAVAFLMAKTTNETVLNALSRETRILREQDAYESASLLARRNSCEDVIDATITSGRLASFFILYGVIWLILVLYRLLFIWRRNKEKDAKTRNTVLHNATFKDSMEMDACMHMDSV